MALSNSQYESIMRVYNRTQLQKKHELDARVDEVYEKIPAVREMNDAIAAAAVKSAKELLAGDADAVKRLRGTIADLKEQRQVLMSASAIRRTIWRCSIIVRTVRIPGTKTV